MKGKVRLALSSYIAVVVGCSPALALQESAMAPARLVAMSAVSVERGVPAAPAPSHEARPAAVMLPHASAAAAETLAVSVVGPAQVQSAATPRYRAAVANGASSSRYYFWWFAANCARRMGCAPSSYTLVAEGLGRDSVTLPVGPQNAERNLVVQVAELDGTGRTGSSPMFTVSGPAAGRLHAPLSGTAKPTCDWFAGSFYPHTGDYKDPYSGRTWPRKFRRDYCGNRVSWDPEGI
jgi:hypothetical protein